MPGAGKEEFVKIAQKRGHTVVRMGDAVREEAKKRSLPQNDRAIGSLAHEEREKYGYGIWAVRTLAKINEADDKNVVIDGCRGDAEVTVFKQNFSDLDVVAVFSSPDTRYDRLRNRRRGDAPMTIEDFWERDQRELKWGIGNVFATADYLIVNDADLASYQAKINSILDLLSKKKRE